MRWKIVVALTLLLIALIPGVVLAQDNQTDEDDGDLLLRINGTVMIAADERVGSAVVISGDAVVEGTVDDVLVVIDGNITLSGTVEHDVVVINGEIEMTDSARIGGDLNLYDSEVVQTGGAVVEGDINEESTFTFSAWDTFVISILFWIAITLLVLLAALVFAAIGGRQLVTASSFISERIGGTLLAALLVGILIPIIAVLAFITLFGIPVAITLLIVVLPMLAFLGYIVAGTRLGLEIVARGRPLAAIDHPYLSALLGVLLLQLIGLIPFVGGLIIFIAAVLGTGALALVAWDAWRKPGAPEIAPAAAPGPEPVATN